MSHSGCVVCTYSADGSQHPCVYCGTKTKHHCSCDPNMFLRSLITRLHCTAKHSQGILILNIMSEALIRRYK